MERKLTKIRDLLGPEDRYADGYIVDGDTGEVLLDFGEPFDYKVVRKLAPMIYNRANIYYEEGFISSR